MINQLDQYFQFVKGMKLEEVISEPLTTLYIIYINQNLPSIHGLDKDMQLYMIIAYTVGFYCLKSVRCC